MNIHHAETQFPNIENQYHDHKGEGFHVTGFKLGRQKLVTVSSKEISSAKFALDTCYRRAGMWVEYLIIGDHENLNKCGRRKTVRQIPIRPLLNSADFAE